MSNGVRLEGFEEFKKKLSDSPKRVQREALSIVTDLAGKWKNLAIRSAPVDQSTIVNGISFQVVDKDTPTAEVYSNAAHSAFVEWGTKGKRVVPADLVNYAGSLQYKKTGDYYDFLKSILDWVKRKGLGVTYSVATRRKNRQTKDEYLQIAEAVAWSIMKKGINPHPFFFIHKANIEAEMKQRLKGLFGDA